MQQGKISSFRSVNKIIFGNFLNLTLLHLAASTSCYVITHIIMRNRKAYT